ncbi:hypothetical protein ACIGH6_05745 [Brachybacterium paraconglomeratum]|uniref:hypothetical protein n=1 Tax=Brachybacterium paraconglomeratum TaxID=173362 RepID=UPI0037CB27C5
MAETENASMFCDEIIRVMPAGTSSTDFTTAEFADILSRLEPHLPISDAFEADLPQRTGSWWTNQREHMVAWFRGQDSTGSGKFTKRAPDTSARLTYNRLLAPAAFVWMAEALGVSPEVVQAAADAARAEGNARKRPGVIRSHLPWDLIAARAETVRRKGPRRS